jgi:5-formyltetrahydrofolate cyclo-ligase
MSALQSKEELRAVFLPLPEEEIVAVQGRLAERLRRLSGYRQSRQVFIEPTILLRQARINALLDGKDLIMPAAGLKEGFYLLKPFTIPFKKLGISVTYKGLADHGQKIFDADVGSLNISLLVGESLLVDDNGWRLGGGEGFFDLAVALLGEMNGLAESCRVVSALAVSTSVTEVVPHDPWDVRCDVILSPDKIIELTEPAMLPGIKWESLSKERIKRIAPLWHLDKARK